MAQDVVVRVRLPEASPDAYIRVTRACRDGARDALRDPLLEDLAAAVSWQIVDQAVRARLDGRESVAPALEIEPEHVELAREYARRGRPLVNFARSEDARTRDLLRRCIRTVEDRFGRSTEAAAIAS